MSKNLEYVSLEDIEEINPSELNPSRLKQLENGYSSFQELIEGKTSDPIVLDASKKPYRIIDGRHRIYLAKKKGFKKVKALLYK